MPTVTVPPSYGDFSTADDYHALQNRIAETNALFYKTPGGDQSQLPERPWPLARGREHQNRQQRPGTAREMGMDVPSGTPKAPTEGGLPPAPPRRNPRKRAPMRP